ncbi:unnamed protein product [Protopolystoma xenopodis]|uniref:Uncharacterized protein n=1 Tax=Protopolystoma xenopodis TaxID=117903 RepID=A0A3S5A8D3_9PLAT|nr:unnamed protein product [Protopolystoma xenopodis]
MPVSSHSPLSVVPPVPVSVRASSREVVMQLTRVSEERGKIRDYHLVVAPVHLATTHPDGVSIEKVSCNPRACPPEGRRHVVTGVGVGGTGSVGSLGN